MAFGRVKRVDELRGRWRANARAASKQDGEVLEVEVTERVPEKQNCERMERALSGAIGAPGGERLVLRNSESYAPGGDGEISFRGKGGHHICTWKAPERE